jgi:hypothetical protein
MVTAHAARFERTKAGQGRTNPGLVVMRILRFPAVLIVVGTVLLVGGCGQGQDATRRAVKRQGTPTMEPR